MTRSRKIRIGAAVVASCLAIAAFGVAQQDATTSTTVIGMFADASPVIEGTEVRAAGVGVGTVESIRLENGKGRVELSVRESVLPLHTDATLKIRPVSLLGEQYIELDPGDPAKPVLGDQVIDERHTSRAVELQEIINTLDDPTSTALAALVTGLGEGLHGTGADAAAAIKALAPAMNRTAELGTVLDQQNEALTDLVDTVTPVVEAAAADGALDRLVGSTEQSLSTLAANQRALDTTLAQLPATVAKARRTLSRLAGVSDAATPALKSVRPVTQNLSQISKELRAFAETADPALASLRPVLQRADVLLDKAAPVVRGLKPAAADLTRTADSARPVLDQLVVKRLGDLMDFVKWWSLSTNGHDGLSNYFRGVLVATPQSLVDTGLATVPGKTPDPSDVLGALPKLPKVTDALPTVPGDLGNVTGLSEKQEGSLLGQLLGGN